MSARVLMLLLLVPFVAAQPADPLRPVPFLRVELRDSFWKPRVERTLERTIPHNFALCERTGRLANFDRASSVLRGGDAAKYEGYFFNDSDVYKAVEAASYGLALRPDAQREAELDALITRIAGAQEPSGYLNSYFALTPAEKRWENTEVRHELYCAGHLIEAGVAHHQITGKRSLIDVALRLADHIADTFGPGRNPNPCGHQEIELALVRLADLARYGSPPRTGAATSDSPLTPDVTRADRYLQLARFFVEQRGSEQRKLYGEYAQDHLPLERQNEVVGHAVRAMYYYSAVADLALRLPDANYLPTLERVWNDLTLRKMYVTGGIGNSSHNEGFTKPYDLPNADAYAETCAAIGLVLFNHRMNLLTGDARYVDVLERAAYNGVLSGISLSGDAFFYVNPLASHGQHARREWYDCACCPPNLARFFPRIGGYVYAFDEQTLYVNLFVDSRARFAWPGGGGVVAEQTTQFPWEGAVRLKVTSKDGGPQRVRIRVPDWAAGATVRVADVDQPLLADHRGYWTGPPILSGVQELELQLPVEPRRVYSDPRVRGNVGRVALARGPLVYCMENADNPGQLNDVFLPSGAALRAIAKPDLLGGITAIQAEARLRSADPAPAQLYRDSPPTQAATLTAIPYYAWANREAGAMRVWIPESVAFLDPAPLAGVTPSASHCFSRDSTAALCDRVEPSASDDHSVPRFTWWPRRGDTQWVQYEFAAPRRVQSVSVYWFDDRSRGGGCRVPVRARLSHRVGDQWREVEATEPLGVAADQFNTLSFAPIETSALRLEVELEAERSAGILEWRLE